MSPLFETSRGLESPGIRHGFFGRQNPAGGDFDMSLLTGTDPQTVEKNRRTALKMTGLETSILATSRQVHGTKVRTLTHAGQAGEIVEADGMVTSTQGIALGILTADCVPVLFADPSAGVIGACHAGWRSAVGGIVENTIVAMEALGAQRRRIACAMGPAISAPNYEVGPDWANDRRRDCPAAAPFILIPSGGMAHFDLPGFVLFELGQARLSAPQHLTPQQLGGCTFGNPERYFSHRHAQTHDGAYPVLMESNRGSMSFSGRVSEPDNRDHLSWKRSSAPGRQISIIGLNRSDQP